MPAEHATSASELRPRSETMLETDSRVASEVPRSPRSRSPIQCRYCESSGRSRPELVAECHELVLGRCVSEYLLGGIAR